MSYAKILYLFLLLYIFSVVPVVAQRNKAFFLREKQRKLEKIKATESILNETSLRKQNSLGELTALNQRIKDQETLITLVEYEIEVLNLEIKKNNDILQNLQKDLLKLKAEYGAMAFSVQKTLSGVTKLMLLFSSASFDQFSMRVKYMEQYGKIRKSQVEAIKKTQEKLAQQVLEMEERIQEKNELLRDQVAQKDKLNKLNDKQQVIISVLDKQEKKLKQDLTQAKNEVAKLDKMIEDIVKEEILKAKKKAIEKQKASKTVDKASDPIILSSSFEKNKSKLPWPVKGFVSQKFGRQDHPVLKGIVLQNDGINIQASQNATVRTVFSGEVRAIAFFQTLGNSLIISHGDYFTVYSGLKNIKVKTGQQVTANQEIGSLLTNIDGISELRFQIRKNTKPLNPIDWLSP